MLNALLFRRHQSDSAIEIAQAATRNGHAAIVIVVAEPGFASPHGESAARIQPAIAYRSDIEIGVRDEASGIFPVVGKEQFPHSMSWFFANDGRKAGVEDGVVDDVVAGAMVLMPTSLPVSHDGGRLVLANQIADSKFRLFIDGNFSVWVWKE